MTTPIYEITPQTTPDDLTLYELSENGQVALLVHDSKDTIDYRQVLAEMPVPCAALAFVSRKKLRPHRQMAVCTGLSRQYGCPCNVFRTPEQARAWLENRLTV